MSNATPSFRSPVVISRGQHDQPMVVLLHGRGSDASDIIGLADQLPGNLAYTAVRAPIAEGGGFAWFANRGIGRPLADSLTASMAWFRTWLDEVVATERPVFLVGFSGGAAFAGGLVLADPRRFAGTAILNGTLPFEAGVPTTPHHLSGVQVFLAHGLQDTVIPADLQARTWQYLTLESGATTVARRDPVGHSLTQPVVTALSAWLTDLAEDLA
jgi:phospholipase/carboxylesterase